MTAHAKLSASGSAIWMNCLGSAQLNAGKKGSTSVYAQEGTTAHAIGEALLLNETPSGPVEDEMMDAVRVYVDFCRSVTPTDAEFVAVEQTVKLDKLWSVGDAPKDPMFGQCDYVCRHGNTLNVIDYKHGKGVPVDVKGNTQIRYYALGALLMMDDHLITQVNMTIVQPRAPHDDGPVRTETMTALDLLMWGQRVLRPIVDDIEMAKEGELPLTDGSWCRWCPSLGDCPQVHKTAMSVAQMEFSKADKVPPPPQGLNNTQIANILNHSDKMRAWLSAIQGEASHRIDQGQDISGWKLVTKRANRAWKDPLDAELFLTGMGVPVLEAYVSPKLKSPTQMLAYLKREKLDATKLDTQIHKPDTGTTLVPASDKRPEVPSGPALDFDVVSED